MTQTRTSASEALRAAAAEGPAVSELPDP